MEYCYISCNALIEYDHHLINDSSIIREIRAIIKITNNYRRHILQTPPDLAEAAAKRYSTMIAADYIKEKRKVSMR